MSLWLGPVIAIAFLAAPESPTVRLQLEPGLRCELGNTIGSALTEQQVKVAAASDGATWGLAVQRDGDAVLLRMTNPQGVVRAVRRLTPTRADCPALPRSVALLVKSWLAMRLGATEAVVRPDDAEGSKSNESAAASANPKSSEPVAGSANAKANESAAASGNAKANESTATSENSKSNESSAASAKLSESTATSGNAKATGSIAAIGNAKSNESALPSANTKANESTAASGNAKANGSIAASGNAKSNESTAASASSRPGDSTVPALGESADERSKSAVANSTEPLDLTAPPAPEFFVAQPGARGPRPQSSQSFSAMLAGGGALGVGDIPVAMGMITVELGFLEPWAIAIDAGAQTERRLSDGAAAVSVSLRWATLSLRRAFFAEGIRGLHVSLGIQLAHLAARSDGFAVSKTLDLVLPTAAANVEWRQPISAGLFLLACLNIQARFQQQNFLIDSRVFVNVPEWGFGLTGGVGWNFL